MLKPKYDREDQIPDNVKGAYVADPSGVWVLDQLDAEHPVVKKNTELVGENTRYKGLNTRLQNEKTSLESRSIPEGYVVVKAEDAPLLDKVKALNLPIDELTGLKTENDAYKQRESEQNTLKLRRGAAESLGYNAEAFGRLATDLDLVQDGDAFFVNVKNDKGVAEKKPLTREFVESSEAFKPFLASLGQQQQYPRGATPDPPASGGSTSVFDRIRDDEKARNDANKPVPGMDIDSLFNRPVAAA